MKDKPKNISFFRRFLIALIIAAIFSVTLSELGYRLLGNTSRPPATIELIIPTGTAELVSAGEADPSIPEEIVFVIGDTLVVKNEDVVDHQLGPLWIPAGRNASLMMEQVNDYAYTCSFQPTEYLGLTIREPITWKSRISALGYALPPTLMFLLVYSFVVFPNKSNKKDDQVTVSA
jgi:hypothetical protein